MVRVQGLLALGFVLCAACGTKELCGNGELDPDEECDDGDDNTNSCPEPGCEYCTTTCQAETTPNIAPPLVVSTDPADEAVGIAVDTTVSATFSEAMDDVTLTDTTFLLESDEGSVAGAVSLATSVATFTPTSLLAFDTTYIATLATDVESDQGVALEEAYTWSFTTRPGIRALGLGQFFSCAVRTDGSLLCWGQNDRDQTGTGLTTDVPRPTAIQAAGIDDWLVVDGSLTHACAVQSDHTLWCWGDNEAGKLGDNSTTDSDVPVQADAPSADWLAVAPGFVHTCAVKLDGTVWCWGRSLSGQLGNGSTEVDGSQVPVQAGSGSNHTFVTSGEQHTCALSQDETLWCWGNNAPGQVGIGSFEVREPVPKQVGTAGDQWISVAAGWFHTCAVKRPGTLWCWGDGFAGATGPNANDDAQRVPIEVDSATDWVEVAAGEEHTCARKQEGTLWCWGNNAGGVLGDGSQDPSETPVQVGTESDWLTVAAGAFHNCAVNIAGEAHCWGNNPFGQIGDGSGVDANWPTAVIDPDPAVAWESVSADKNYACAIKVGGARWCWGNDIFEQLGLGPGVQNENVPTALANETTVWSQIDVGQLHACGIGGGELYCWGSAPSEDADVPTHVDDGPAYPTHWASVVAGQSHTCALRTDDTLHCSGADDYGQLGDDADADGLVERFTANGWVNDWDAMVTGWVHSCALDGDGTAWCWGWNIVGAAGPHAEGIQTTPIPVDDEDIWTALAAAQHHTCGIRQDKSLWCWGQNDEGELGDGTPGATGAPIQVGTDTDWESLATGREHTCAIKTDDSLHCWGLNDVGQLGDGSFVTSNVPVAVGDPAKDWASVTVGDSHTCAIDVDGDLWCWGGITSGQLGNGPAWRTEPVLVLAPED
jgi:alpha-tubulin suppressor-like RCC1 family protein